jgi:hypothetical protein
MPERAAAAPEHEPSWLVALGLLLGVAMTTLSVVGLLWRLTPASILGCLLVAIVTAGRYAWKSGARIPGAVWLAAPFMLPSLAASALPPYTWDEVAYGAALPRTFAKAGRLFYHADYGAYAAFPANYEALVTAALVLTRDVWITQLVGVVLALAMAAMAVVLARALGAGQRTSFVAGLLVLCAPALITTAPLTKNDVANGFFQALAVVVLVGAAGRSAYPPIALSGAFLGVSLGIKYSSLHFALAFAPLAVVYIAAAAPPGERLRRSCVWASCVALVASPWYVRNLALFSNPVFPFLNDWLGARNGFTREHSELLRESFEGLADYSLKAGTPTTFVTRIASGLGALPTALLLPGAWLALRSARRQAGILVGGAAAIHATLTLVAGYWEPRYLLSLLVLASALAALALERVGRLAGVRAHAAQRIAMLATAAAAVATAYPVWTTTAGNARACWQEGRRAFAENRAPYIAVARWLNSHLTHNDRVAIGFNVQPFYYLDRAYYHIHPLTEGELVSARDPGAVEAALRRAGATHLAFSGADGTYFEHTAPKISAYRERLWLAQRRLRQAGRLQLVSEVSGVRILRLTDGATAAASP